MTWTKLTDTATDNPAMLALPRGVRLLHIEAMIWCNRYGTDGRIPRNALARFTDEPDVDNAASALIDAGLWKVTPDGWEIVGFTDPAVWDQLSADQVERQRALKRERTRRWRERRDASRNASHDASGDGAQPSPAQPSPAQPEGSGAVAGAGTAGSDGTGLAADPPTGRPVGAVDPAELHITIDGEEVT